MSECEKLAEEKLDKKMTPTEILQLFIKFRHEYIEDILPYLLVPDHPNYHLYKCRTGFFTGIAAWIDVLIIGGVITDKGIITKAEEFIRYVQEYDPVRTTKKDIDKANAILDIMIAALS